jgi:hypothetical protein
MSSVQARLFEAMIRPRGPQSVLVSMEENFFLGQNFLTDRICDAFEHTKKRPSTLRQAWNRLVKILNMQGVVIEHIDLGHQVKEDYTNGSPPYSIYWDEPLLSGSPRVDCHEAFDT